MNRIDAMIKRIDTLKKEKGPEEKDESKIFELFSLSEEEAKVFGRLSQKADDFILKECKESM